MSITGQLLHLAVVAGGLGCAALSLRRGRHGGGTVQTVSLLLLHVPVLAWRAWRVRFFPLTTVPDVLVWVSLLTLAALCVFARSRARSRMAAGFYLASALLVAASMVGRPADGISQELRSLMLPVHVVGACAAYASFTVSFLLVVAQWIQCALRPGLPSQETRSPGGPALRFAFAGWTLYGIFVLGAGMVWARIAWGRFWAWDPKETLSLAAFCVYSLHLYFEAVIRPQSRVLRGVLALVAYGTVVLTVVLGMRLAGLHSHS